MPVHPEALADVSPALIRAAALWIPIASAWLLWLRRPPGREARAAMVSATAWLLPTLVALNLLALHRGWWSFEAQGGLAWGIPVDLLLGWIVLWGALPVLAFPRAHPAAILPLFLALDLLVMPRMAPVLQLGPGWWAGEALALAAVLLPALVLARWTRRGERLPGRVLLVAIAFSGIFVGLVPSLALAMEGGSWATLFGGPVWRISLRLQVLALPALLGLAAVQEFATRGQGTPLPTDPPRRFVASGPYRYIRNPMQLALVLLWLLLAGFLRSPSLALAAGAAWAYCVGLARWSEAADMAERFGPTWLAYRAAVPAWRPRWRPWVGAAVAGVGTGSGTEFASGAELGTGAEAGTASEPARLYFAASCPTCSELATWLARREPVGLVLSAAEGYPGGGLRRLTYQAPGEAPERGIAALGRALEHVDLAWALLGMALRLPLVRSLAQLIADALGAGPRTLPAHPGGPSAGTSDLEDRLDRQLETFQGAFAAQQVAGAQEVELGRRTVDEDGPVLGLHHPNPLDSDREVVLQLAADAFPAVGGRQDLDDQLGGLLQIGAAGPLGSPGFRNEGDVRCADAVGIATDEDARLAAENPPQIPLTNEVGQSAPQLELDRPVFLARRCHLHDPPIDQLGCAQLVHGQQLRSADQRFD